MIRRDLWDIFVGYSIVEHCLDLVSKSKKAAMTHNPPKTLDIESSLEEIQISSSKITLIVTKTVNKRIFILVKSLRPQVGRSGRSCR